MKILYGVQGTGNGHITRARAMAAELAKHPIEVDFLFSGRDPDKFFDMDIFGNYRVLQGLTFVTEKGRVSTVKTLLNNNPIAFISDVAGLDVEKYDLLITDFEPITAWAGKLRRKPVVGLGHQYAFRYSIPQHHGGIAQHLILKYFAPAKTSLGLHWYHFDQPILPPIAPVSKKASDTLRRHYLVYLPFESVEDIRVLLKPFGAYQFRIYHPDAKSLEESNLSWHRPGRTTFQNDLHRCEGVICNAGFELASEVLQLGKKLLVKPLVGQSEQYSNAMALDLLGYGHVMYRLDASRVANWLQSACATRICYPNVADAICSWVLNGRETDILSMARSLWMETRLPDMTAATRTDHQLAAEAVYASNNVRRKPARYPENTATHR